MQFKILSVIYLIAAMVFFPAIAGAQLPKTAYENRLSDENILLVEVMLDNLYTNETIEIYQYEGGYLIPLGYMAQILDFPIDVDSKAVVANGWFIDESRIFYLNHSKNEVTVKGALKKMDNRLIVSNSSDIYVDSTYFKDWFNIDISMNFAELILTLKPNEKLPVQAKIERDQKYSKMRRFTVAEKNYSKVKQPYKLYDTPFVDADIGYDHGTGKNEVSRMSYSMISQGDLGYLTTKLAVTGEGSAEEKSGKDSDSLTGLRLSAGREDYEGNLLGKMHATSFNAGDINSISTPLVSSSSLGRGFSVSNASLERPDQFDSTNFIGDSQPGWDVELYRNGVLQDFQTVGENGRYEFRDVPLFIGNNTFKIVSYGPQGQVREKTENFNIDNSLLKQGEFVYQFSGDEKSKTIFGVDERTNPVLHDDDVRVVANAEYGITKNMTGGMGYVRTPLKDGKLHEYNTLSLKNNLGYFFTNVNFAYDNENGGNAAQFAAHTVINDVRIRAEHSIYSKFISENEDFYPGQGRESLSKLDFDGSFNKFFGQDISYRFSGIMESFENNREVKTLSNNLSTTIGGIGIGNYLEYQKTDSLTGSSDLTRGSFSIRGRYQSFSSRLSADYDIEPQGAITSVNLVNQKNFEDNSNIILGIRKDLTGDELTTVNASYNKLFKWLTWSLSAQADDDSNMLFGTRLAFALGREPRNSEWFMKNRDISSDGAVSARAFIDRNYNDIFDEGDEVLPDVAFRSNTGGGLVKGDGDKPVMITGISTKTPSDIEIDYSTVENPYLLAKENGYSVATRPGHVTKIDFPLVETTEIDGTVYLDNGVENKAISRVKVELVNEKGEVIKSATSEFDGFYLFESVIPGNYIIRVNSESLKKLSAISSTEEQIIIGAESDIISGKDISIRNNGADNSVEEIDLPPPPVEEKDAPEIKDYSEENSNNEIASVDENKSSKIIPVRKPAPLKRVIEPVAKDYICASGDECKSTPRPVIKPD